jgi:hypothetical protein
VRDHQIPALPQHRQNVALVVVRAAVLSLKQVARPCVMPSLPERASYCSAELTRYEDPHVKPRERNGRPNCTRSAQLNSNHRLRRKEKAKAGRLGPGPDDLFLPTFVLPLCHG